MCHNLNELTDCQTFNKVLPHEAIADILAEKPSTIVLSLLTIAYDSGQQRTDIKQNPNDITSNCFPTSGEYGFNFTCKQDPKPIAPTITKT